MPTHPLISVVVPAYNHAQYIAAAIESILTQDYPRVEIIVVDDGSTDRTAEAAEEILKQGGRPYQLIRQENTGAHAALNAGISLASGETIAILNSDDRYLPGRLSTFYNMLVDSGKRFAYSKVKHVDRAGFQHVYQYHYEGLIAQALQFPTVSFTLLRHNIAVTTGNFFFHRSLYDEVGGFAPFVTCHDWDYILRVLLVEEPLFVNETLLEYRIHSQGALQKHLGAVDEETAQIMLDYLAHVDGAKNDLAPGPAQWGGLWNQFMDQYLERIRAFPAVDAQLAAMRFDGEGALHAGTLPEALPGVPDKPFVDLDFTQISLDIPALQPERKTQLRLLIMLPWMVMGGAERFTLNLMDQLTRRGWQISVLCTTPSDNPWKEEFYKRVDDIVILPDTVPIKDYPRYLRHFLELRNFDMVFLQGSIEGYRLVPTIRGLFPHLPIVDYLHFVTPDWMNGGFPRLSYQYRDGFDLTIASCRQVKEWMVWQGMAEDSVSVCPIGVDAAIWKPDEQARLRVRREYAIREEDVVLTYAARLEAQKQPMVFVETLRILKEKGIQFKALVAGDGSLRGEMEDFIRLSGLGATVRFLGAVKSEEMPAVLAASDIFFLPSQNEGISSAIYEAMASGLPVVGADVGGQRELVTPECGILIPPLKEGEQPAEYADVLIELIANPQRRQQMGTASRERIIGGFTLDHMGECIQRKLDEVVRSKAGGESLPRDVTLEQKLSRETQHVIEYLQARQEFKGLQGRHTDLRRQFDGLSDRYFEALQPKPPSHWFYLWIRQLILVVLGKIKPSRIEQTAAANQKELKQPRNKK